MEDKEFQQLINTDFNQLIEDTESFVRAIPNIAKLIGLQKFQSEMGFTHPQYYRRVNDINKWSLEELKKVAQLLQRYKTGN